MSGYISSGVFKAAADIGLDKKKNILYVPQFRNKRVSVYQLD